MSRTTIEQARARGLTLEATAIELDVNPADVLTVWRAMDEAAVEEDIAHQLAHRDQLDRGPSGRLLEPCGTHAAFVRHKARGEDMDARCHVAERIYQHTRHVERCANQARGENVA